MPKMKTHSSAKKRFKITASGKINEEDQCLLSYSDEKIEKKKVSVSVMLNWFHQVMRNVSKTYWAI